MKANDVLKNHLRSSLNESAFLKLNATVRCLPEPTIYPCSASHLGKSDGRIKIITGLA